VQPVKQILTERPCCDLSTQVSVGRCDDAHVDAKRLGRADAAHLPRFENPQELRLQLRWQLADLVEKESAAGGRFERSFFARYRAGEGLEESG